LIVLDALPRNALSKVDRKALQAMANALQPSSVTVDHSAAVTQAACTEGRGKAVA
jgi:hypothetical protein